MDVLQGGEYAFTAWSNNSEQVGIIVKPKKEEKGTKKPSYTAKSSSKTGVCWTAGTALADFHNSCHKLPAN